MKCPFCTSDDTQVLESRAVDDGLGIRRRRECMSCKKRFTTRERIKRSYLWVIKKNGNRELFEREKIKRGMLRAIEKRPVTLDLIDEMVDDIEREMLNKESEEVPSSLIGKEILKRLKKTDKVAWLRFASVYMEFKDLEDFSKVMESPKPKRKRKNGNKKK